MGSAGGDTCDDDSVVNGAVEGGGRDPLSLPVKSLRKRSMNPLWRFLFSAGDDGGVGTGSGDGTGTTKSGNAAAKSLPTARSRSSWGHR